MALSAGEVSSFLAASVAWMEFIVFAFHIGFHDIT